ncbi:HamA C-terminal domain-containing protein [Calycomorphotria hydatis]|uniref:HamA C-terminal domain-containing protein n=1 Tax=Calycomorphotria hydatis TaxID=2528027 RepID=UPI001E38F1B2|nr:DUF1837 domain-containing protein [Calycomorphotria hydatis]
MSIDTTLPLPFLDVRVHDIAQVPGLTALCAGYELGEWRSDQLSSHVIEWLPDFALSRKELESLGPHNIVRLLTRAAQVVYNTHTAKPSYAAKGGELGELLLHIAVRQVFTSVPAISKFYYKDSPNDPVKGFDAVHVVMSDKDLQLWLGEVKFYKSINNAIKDVVEELAKHTAREYLRSEFIAITNKIDDNWQHAERLKKLIDKTVSLDTVFDSVVIPVLLSYESKVTQSHSAISNKFLSELEKEVRTNHKNFSGKSLPENVGIHLFLFPMKDKMALVNAFNKRLAACQSI